MVAPAGMVDLKDIYVLLWRRKWLLALFCVAGAASMAGVSLLYEKKYEAIVVLSPVSLNSPGTGGIGSLVSQFGGIASLAGLSLGGADSGRNESVAFLRSKQLVSQYIAEQDLLKILFRSAENSRQSPTLWQGVEFFSRRVRTVTAEASTGLISLRVTWTDPEVAAAWANGLVATANSRLRERAITESERNIAYLNDQAAKTDMVGARQAIYALLQTEINKVMIARAADQYAFKVIDPATAPEKPSSPGILVWAGFGLLVVIVAAICIAFLVVVFQGPRSLTA